MKKAISLILVLIIFFSAAQPCVLQPIKKYTINWISWFKG